MSVPRGTAPATLYPLTDVSRTRARVGVMPRGRWLPQRDLDAMLVGP